MEPKYLSVAVPLQSIVDRYLGLGTSFQTFRMSELNLAPDHFYTLDVDGFFQTNGELWLRFTVKNSGTPVMVMQRSVMAMFNDRNAMEQIGRRLEGLEALVKAAGEVA